MRNPLRMIMGTALAACLVLPPTGCNNEAPEPGAAVKTDGGMDKDKMGGMDKDKMGGMDKDKMGGMDKDKMGGMDKGKMEGASK